MGEFFSKVVFHTSNTPSHCKTGFFFKVFIRDKGKCDTFKVVNWENLLLFTAWEIRGESGIMYKWAWHVIQKLNKWKEWKSRQEAKLAKRILMGSQTQS